jgi:Na+-driven multidrug efflux pump
MGIINSIQTLMLMPIIGLNQGVQPIISFNFGAKKFDRVKQAVKLGYYCGDSYM